MFVTDKTSILIPRKKSLRYGYNYKGRGHMY